MSKVLIIEDRREQIVFIANNILKPMGYDIITAMDGRTGLEKAIEERPDLIITDLKLPRMSGLEVLAQLRKKEINIPSIVMTFHGTEDTAMRALRLGARDYLIKPFTIEEIQAAINRALQPVGVHSQADGDYERLEKELAQTRAALAEREDQLKRLSTASQMAAKVPKLEKEVAQLRSALAQQGGQTEQTLENSSERTNNALRLEQELAETRNLLVKRENQLRQAQKYLVNLVKKTNVTEDPTQVATLKEDNARLKETLTQAQKMLDQSNSRIEIMESTFRTQKSQLDKYQQQTRKLAEELRNLSEAVRLLSQDLGHQTKQMESVGREEKGR